MRNPADAIHDLLDRLKAAEPAEAANLASEIKQILQGSTAPDTTPAPLRSASGGPVPYADDRESLLHPGAATDFFLLKKPTSDAELCVEMARAAYVKDTASLSSYLQRVDFRLVDMLSQEGTQAFIADGTSPSTNTPVTVIAFRGTEPGDPSDLFADGTLPLIPWSRGGNVHMGFAQALKVVEQDILKVLSSGRATLLTGHSLGGALATLAATLGTAGGTYTFGCPRVGDATFAQLPGAASKLRYVDCCDIVTRVPPESFGYVHSGQLAFIDGAGAFQPAWSADQIAEEQRSRSLRYIEERGFLKGTVPLRELADHAPINYSSAVLGVRQQ